MTLDLGRALDGASALISGAGNGIGREAALVFARDGARVIAADLDADAAAETAALVEARGGTCRAVRLDVTSRQSVDAAVATAVTEFGGLDCAFNNAGISGPLAPLVGYPEDELRKVLEVNVLGVWNCLQAQLPVMLDAGNGAIVNASSGLGVVASPNMAPYVASKHAVLGLTQAAALEYSARGVRVNAVLPGVIDTAMPSTLTSAHPEVWEAMRASHPVGRLGRAEEVAEAAAWLCSPLASFVTGHGLAVDGGHLVQ